MAKAFGGLVIRKLADKSSGQRVRVVDPETGNKVLVNPETGQAESWPLLGVMIVGDPPKRCKVPTLWVARGKFEGWIEFENERLEHRPGGPVENKWALTHTFVHVDALIIKCVDGDVRYNVARHPDKYAWAGDDVKVTPDLYEAGETQVDWFYELELA